MDSNRRSSRHEASFPATVNVGGKSIRDVVSNVSSTGLYLEAERHRFRLGERVRVAFSLPVSGRLVPITVEGRIARIVRDSLNRTKGIGVELVSPAPAAISTIEAYLQALAAIRPPLPSGPRISEGARIPAGMPQDSAEAITERIDEDELTDPAVSSE